ncbi:YveK family protein [Clostridium sp.]
MESEVKFSMRKYTNIIKKGKWIIIIITLLSTMAGVKLSINSGIVTYMTDETVIIGTEGDATNNQNLIKTYIEIVKSNSVAEKASAKLDRSVSSIQIAKSITVNMQLNTAILKIETISTDKNQAFDIINAVSDSFLEESQRLYPDGKVQIMDQAKEPIIIASTYNVRNTAIAFIMGLMASIIILITINYMDITVKSEDDIVEQLGLPIIGNIQKYKTK